MPEADSSNCSDISFEIPPFIRVYKDGRIYRPIGTDFVHASTDPATGVQSKDVHILPHLNVTARLYLPQNADLCHKLPLLVYFHGGAFFTGSAFNPKQHDFLNSLVAKAKVVAVSVNYRLAPEYPLPIAYEDSWLALKWVFSHTNDGDGNEPWLNDHVDFDRVCVGGVSAGGNIAHNMAMLAGVDENDDKVVLDGMFLNFPHFWGEQRIGNEVSDLERVSAVEKIWVHAYPSSKDSDDPASNPGMDPNISKLGCKRVLVYVAENDVLKDRGWYYAETLRNGGWGGDVKVVEVKGEDHVFNLRFPDSAKAKKMLEDEASFLNHGAVKQHRVD